MGQKKPVQYTTYKVVEKPVRRKRRGGGFLSFLLKLLVITIIIILILNLPQTKPYVQKAKDKIKEWWDGLPPLVYREYAGSVDYTIIRTVMLNVSGGSITYDLKYQLPQDLSSGYFELQKISSISSSPARTMDGSTMTWTGTASSTSPGVVTITYNFRANGYIWSITPEQSGNLSDIPASLKNTYCVNEWPTQDGKYIIHPSDPTVASIASQLSYNETNVYLLIDNIYNYMLNNYKYYSRSGLPKTATQTLQDKWGDCDDQSALMMSLLRTLGIPCRMCLGLLYNPSTGQWGGHAWIEVYIPLKAGGGVNATIDVVNKEFLFRDAYRLQEFTDTGNGDDLKNAYYQLSYRSISGRPEVQFSDTITTVSAETHGSIKIPVDIPFLP
ncbi:MAG: transglutaminase-like domain-containing protein [Thermoplasmata archaeon]